MFNYDWFHGLAFQQQIEEAKARCVHNQYPDVTPDKWEKRPDIVTFQSELEIRTLLYLRDGFSYEIRAIAEVESRSHLVFECEPVEERYKVGAFVITVPFEEVARVEVFAVHPTEKPDDMPQITGFRQSPEGPVPADPAAPKPSR